MPGGRNGPLCRKTARKHRQGGEAQTRTRNGPDDGHRKKNGGNGNAGDAGTFYLQGMKPLMHETSRLRDISDTKQKTRREAVPRVWLKMNPARGN